MSDDRKLRELFSQAASRPGPELKSRALAAMARGAAAKPRPRRLLAFASGLALIIGLSFVPFPLGKTSGALQKALAAMEGAETVYITGRSCVNNVPLTFKRWVAKDFSRGETYRNGELELVILDYRGRRMIYSKAPIYYSELTPSVEYNAPRIKGNRTYRWPGWIRLNTYLKLPIEKDPSCKIQESKIWNIWEGESIIVEIRTEVTDRPFGYGEVDYSKWGELRSVYKIDPESHHVLSMEQYYSAENWRKTYEAEYHWNVPVPDSLKHFSFPPGTVISHSNWWDTREDKVVRSIETKDWILTLHAIDVNREGEIYLSLTRVLKPESKLGPWEITPLLLPKISVQDNLGHEYDGIGPFERGFVGDMLYGGLGCYRTSKDKPGAPLPRAITLTVYPYPTGKSRTEKYVLRDIPLPPRQKGNRLCLEDSTIYKVPDLNKTSPPDSPREREP
jgi:hypothetical protein